MKQIKTLEDLEQAVKKKQLVYNPKSCACMFHNHGCISSAFMMDQQGSSLLKIFRQGLYIYEPKKRARKGDK